MGTVLDVTERKCLERELARSSELRERFMGIVSHDLRNPLSVIRMGAASLLKSKELPGSLTRTADRLLASANSMVRMISDLLDMTRGRLGGGIPVEPKPADLRNIAPAVIEGLEAACPGRPIQSELRGRLDGTWDADRIAQAIGNLVSNALEHGDPEAPVRVDVFESNDRVVVAVHNEGQPIAPDQGASLFDPFRKGESKGLGLGLFIAQEIARAHGGAITLTSTETEGTTFRLTLPRDGSMGASAGG
jgi:signal transduction histidine kinase